MSDLFMGQTMTYGAQFISDGSAHTFTFPFQPDRVTFYNYTKYGTSDTFVQHTWFRGFPAGDALQIGVGTAPAAKIALETTNGFTEANTAGGVSSRHANITAISQADPCVVTHDTYTFQTNQIVRLTDLGADMPVARGMDELNNKRFRIVVLGATTFSLKDPISGEPIDSTAFVAYVTGGRITLETAVLTLNNPEQPPQDVTPYVPNPFAYDPVEYKLTAGSAVIGADSDVIYIEAIKYGEYVDLGDIA